MNVDLQTDDLADGAVIELLRAHLEEMRRYSPEDSIHALDTGKLKDPCLTFWTARVDGQLAGCGALREISPRFGEVKSMKTAGAFLRRGIAARILEAIIAEAWRRGYARISLETGTDRAFEPAVALYQKYGFVECGPFADYAPDPYSRFLTRAIRENAGMA
ncbi:GNAT family N-acetyltransferase [Microbulbifer sediminum]|uniref:GNAT family N-acetyltransferase n=1 Tax=Microbulbifer sediminum TaxID=2904250 RepID=UPI001F2931EF|nr:GNAT family N-acetyltransferase [Microbulbifer sediminum]